eukprot:gnl/TRDRNA2_/TRDRNA2_61339_c0_seq1.p1 gnl/TRDRNA2_/TRDRNA2_61339_c0~~gnl/TRDRNA2_/TRDRNA2_61339_c0_seq1.p1  ORF type:complete len:600 (-),score=109.44 gnl/TRDRNA2_/TRDRNA2_61339_c0_seq1:65-1726(-)
MAHAVTQAVAECTVQASEDVANAPCQSADGLLDVHAGGASALNLLQTSMAVRRASDVGAKGAVVSIDTAHSASDMDTDTFEEEFSPPTGSEEFYSSLLPKAMQESAEEEKRLRSWSAANPSSVIHLVEQHHQAFNWWVRALHGALERSQGQEAEKAVELGQQEPKRGRLLVHVDSHSDIGVDSWDHLSDADRAGERAGIARFMSNKQSIGNFIATGTMAGLVSDVIWVRSNFHDCDYNGPELGSYLAGFFVTKKGKGVCQKILSKKSSHPEDDKAVGINTDGFDTCGEDAPISKSAKPVALFNLTVTTLGAFSEDLTPVLKGELPKEWILDVDEDFFASYAPGWHFLAHFLRGLSEEQRTNTRTLLTELGEVCKLDDGSEDLMKLMQTLPKRIADDAWDKWDDEGLECNLSEDLKKRLASLSTSLTSAQRKHWVKGWKAVRTDEFVSDADTAFQKDGTMPEGVPSKEELQGTLENFGGAVRGLREKLGNPCVVTMCRSLLNGYLPKSKWPAIESGVHDVLRRELKSPDLSLAKDARNPSEDGYNHLSMMQGPQ